MYFGMWTEPAATRKPTKNVSMNGNAEETSDGCCCCCDGGDECGGIDGGGFGDSDSDGVVFSCFDRRSTMMIGGWS